MVCGKVYDGAVRGVSHGAAAPSGRAKSGETDKNLTKEVRDGPSVHISLGLSIPAQELLRYRWSGADTSRVSEGSIICVKARR